MRISRQSGMFSSRSFKKIPYLSTAPGLCLTKSTACIHAAGKTCSRWRSTHLTTICSRSCSKGQAPACSSGHLRMGCTHLQSYEGRQPGTPVGRHWPLSTQANQQQQILQAVISSRTAHTPAAGRYAVCHWTRSPEAMVLVSCALPGLHRVCPVKLQCIEVNIHARNVRHHPCSGKEKSWFYRIWGKLGAEGSPPSTFLHSQSVAPEARLFHLLLVRSAQPAQMASLQGAKNSCRSAMHNPGQTRRCGRAYR